MVHLRDANFRDLERELAEDLGARRVWVQYSNNASRVRVIVTVFPQGHGAYAMHFGDRVLDFSYDSIRALIK